MAKQTYYTYGSKDNNDYSLRPYNNNIHNAIINEDNKNHTN